MITKIEQEDNISFFVFLKVLILAKIRNNFSLKLNLILIALFLMRQTF